MDKTLQQVEREAEFREFATEHVRPYAHVHDTTQRISESIIPALAQHGFFAPFLPTRWGGQEMDMQTYGVLHEEIGRACSSVRSLLTVHDMVVFSILRWGSDLQRERWLAPLRSGALIAAFAISEPNAGSDVNGVETRGDPEKDGFRINGRKKWITFGQIAGVFLVLAQVEGKPTAFLIERDTPGLTVEPILGMLGTRGSMLALLNIENCWVSGSQVIGRIGFGANPVALSALGLGRYSVACGSLGIAQACLEACYSYASRTQRFGAALKDYQLIQELMTDMMTDVAASRLLCRLAGSLKDQKDPQEILQTFIAKYHASRSAMRAATNAVQIHGANGCSPDCSVERLFRDAKVMEIIEGSNQIQQITIATLGFQEFERQRGLAQAADSRQRYAQHGSREETDDVR
jgi:glutaryl-CoA dehydrogenase (non-decarboxylating)